jgi:hypothetical protein
MRWRKRTLLPNRFQGLVRSTAKQSRLAKEKKMEDFPIWLKLVIWGTIGLTVGYTIWGMLSSIGHT